MVKQVCDKCKKMFAQNEKVVNSGMAEALNSEEAVHECFNCALNRITSNHAPEEGDFNTARIVSGEVTDEEWREMQETFRALEEGRAPSNNDQWYAEDEEDDRWDDDSDWYCYYCEQYPEDCECPRKVEAHPDRDFLSGWEEYRQGPEPSEEALIGRCEGCGTHFNNTYDTRLEIPTPHGILKLLARHDRKKCRACS